MRFWPRLRRIDYGYPYAEPVYRRDYRLLIAIACFALFVLCMWGLT